MPRRCPKRQPTRAASDGPFARENAVGRDVTFESGSTRLVGSFSVPNRPGPFAAVLMLPGSGQTDRDDNVAKLRIDALPQLAAFVAPKGFASLRYDKRGVGASEGDYWKTGLGDRVADAAAGLAWLRSQEDVDAERVYVLGHSEGALIAIQLAGADMPMAGAILLAATAHSGEETLVWQAQRIAQGMRGFNKWLIGKLHIDVRESQRKALDRIKRTERDWVRVRLVQKVNVKWMREFLAYDPAEDLARIRVPVLALTGSKDIQVDPADLELMARWVRSDFESHEVPDVTHLLRADPGEPSLATYRRQVLRPVDPRVLELVGDWLERKSGRAAAQGQS
jgi:uncharacterized protein